MTTNVGTQAQPVSRTVWSYFDGLGRQLVQVEPSEVSGSWVVHGGRVVGSVTGRTETAWRPFFQSLAAGSAYDVQGTTPSGPDEAFTYDALGRVATTTDELNRMTFVAYQPTLLSRTVQDAEQVLAGGPHNGASTVTKFDGHGRVVSTGLNMAHPQDAITAGYGYLATGEVKSVTKSHSGGAGMFVRGLAYDSLGRVVENQEPNTSGARDWLYAYDDSGRLVGTSDARGCGKNIAYDNLGRVVGDDYSPCDAAGAGLQAPYSAPEPGSPTGAGYEVFNKYDVPETPELVPAWYAGRLTATYDRAQHTQIELDGRGRVSAINRQVMAPDQLDYSPHVFRRQMSYDEANRVVSATTGADTSGLTAQAGSALSTAYTVRGGVSSVGMPYGGGKLLQQRQFDATNSPTSETYIGMAGPSQIISYYPDGALHELQTFPGASNGLAAVQDLLINYDLVDNPVAIVDQSTYSWPAGIEAASRGTLAQPITYDDAYRVTKVPTLYGPSGGATSPDVFSTGKAMPYAPEIVAGDESFPFTLPLANRVTSQSFGYDWLDNVQSSDDDQHAAPDRSFGVASYPPTGPANQLVSATQNGTSITATYDPAGNTTSVTVNRGPLTNGSCEGPCVTTYLYAWDEVGQMSNAARVEGATASSGQTRVRFAYTYDGGGARVIRFEANEAQEDSQPVLSYDVNVFSTLRLETTSTPDGGDYEATDATEIVYLQDGAGQTYGRAFVQETVGTTSGGPVRVYLEFGDHLGSTAAVVDAATGNIVERTSYLAYGAVDADYRPDSEGNFREPFRYTGHEDDSQVGLTYFGARYYIPTLARWASPDPLTIHGLGSSLNPYAFVRNSPLGNVDPFGLDEAGPPTQEPESPVPVSGGGSLCLFNCNSGGQGNGAGGGQPLGSPRGHGPTLQLTLTPWASSGADANKLWLPTDEYYRSHTWSQFGKGFANQYLQLAADEMGMYVGWTTSHQLQGLLPMAMFSLDPNDDGGVGKTVATVVVVGASFVAGGIGAIEGKLSAVTSKAADTVVSDVVATAIDDAGQGVSAVVRRLAAEGEAAEETITLYHGSVDNFSGIMQNGLDAARAPTWVTNDLAAAQNAIGRGRVLSPGQGLDTGIVTSTVPMSQFQAIQQAGGISGLRVWPGFGGGQTFGEYVLRSAGAIELFNLGIGR